MLQSLISLKRAYQTDEWIRIKSVSEKDEININLTEKECVDFFERIKGYEERYDAMFSSHPKLDITYEDLVSRKDEVMNSLTDFLGVDRFSATSVMKKQITKPAHQVISNYSFLKTKFENSQWACFFQ
jgi:LPS sulfotransferase NodH